MMLTIEEINNQIKSIVDNMWDDEVAHSSEDSMITIRRIIDLREEFIKHIAENGPPELSKMAKLVLSTNNLDFGRWWA